MPEPQPLKLAYKLIDPNSGAVVVADLYHLHQSTWTVRALLAGYPGSTSIGEFRILLPAPYSEEHGRNRAQYDAILSAANRGIGLKVEGYLADVNAGQGSSASFLFAGSPVVTGVITKMDLPMDGPWVLAGPDTLFWLQQSQVLPGEQVAPNFSSNTFGNFLGTAEVLWDDDFATFSGLVHPNSSDYTVSGFTANSADPLFGLPNLTASADGNRAITTATWTDLQFGSRPAGASASSVSIHGVLVAGTSTANAGSPQIFLVADATGQNGYLVAAQLVQTGVGTGLYNVSLFIYSIAAGVFTQQATAANVFVNVPATFPFELTAIVSRVWTGPGTVLASIRALLNGKDPGCVYSGFTSPASGSVGIRMGMAAGGVPALYVNRIQFHSRTSGNSVPGWGTNRFQPGSVTTSPHFFTSPITGQGQTHLDVLLLMAAFDGVQLRKSPGAGPKTDAIDYAASPGVDLSQSVVFEERVNVVAQGSTLTNVAELYATDVRLNSIPGVDSGGSVTWSRIGAAGDMALVDTVNDVGVFGFGLLVNYARAIQARKVAPVVATQLAVARLPDLLSQNSGWGPRELDFVTVHLPSYGILRQRAQIVGLTVTEGSGTIIYYLTQFPEARLPQAGLQRMTRTLDYLTTTYASR